MRVHAVTPKLVICVMYLTSIWRILLMTDGLNAVSSNDCAAPTDTNPKNLELAPPQSVTATRLDQLVYSPNYYIQIFQTQPFARSEDWTLNLHARSYQVQRAYQLRYGCTLDVGLNMTMYTTRVCKSANYYTYIAYGRYATAYLLIYVSCWYIPLSRSARNMVILCCVALEMVLLDNLNVYKDKLPE